MWDPLVGDFTLTSKTSSKKIENDDDKMKLLEYENPAKISTTFPRAIKQDEGYEIALKSIAHAPVKNLIHSNVTLARYDRTNSSIQRQELVLTSRFYESQADILMEIHRVIDTLSIDDPPVLALYEKNNETTMKFTNDYFLKIKEDMFLNRPFKFKVIERGQQRSKRSEEQIDIPSRTSVDNEHIKLQKNISDVKSKNKKKFKTIEDKMKKFKQEFDDFYKIISTDPALVRLDRNWLTKHLLSIDKRISDSIVQTEQVGDDLESQKELIKSIEQTLTLIGEQLGEVQKLSIAVYNNRLDIEGKVKNLRDQIDSIQLMISKILLKILDLQKQLEVQKAKLTMHISDMEKQNDGMEDEVNRLRRHVDEKHQEMVGYMKTLTEQLGIDADQSIAIDTSNYVSSKTKREINVSEITVSSAPIVTTRLGMIYCGIVENSLINNKQTRLLTSVPIISRRGYNYYEFKTPIYKVISVLQFSTISFTIADAEGFLMDFSLEGDELSNYQSDAKRKYPTMLNLHIRRRL